MLKRTGYCVPSHLFFLFVPPFAQLWNACLHTCSHLPCFWPPLRPKQQMLPVRMRVVFVYKMNNALKKAKRVAHLPKRPNRMAGKGKTQAAHSLFAVFLGPVVVCVSYLSALYCIEGQFCQKKTEQPPTAFSVFSPNKFTSRFGNLPLFQCKCLLGNPIFPSFGWGKRRGRSFPALLQHT